LIKTLGSWPVTSDAESGVWSDASWSLEEALNAAHHYKSFPFFVTAVGVDDKNSSSHVVAVCPRALHIIAWNYPVLYFLHSALHCVHKKMAPLFIFPITQSKIN